jgi:hypothetical protein
LGIPRNRRIFLKLPSDMVAAGAEPILVGSAGDIIHGQLILSIW